MSGVVDLPIGLGTFTLYPCEILNASGEAGSSGLVGYGRYYDVHYTWLVSTTLVAAVRPARANPCLSTVSIYAFGSIAPAPADGFG